MRALVLLLVLSASACGGTPLLDQLLDPGGFYVELEAEEGAGPEEVDAAVPTLISRLGDLGGVTDLDIERTGPSTLAVRIAGFMSQNQVVSALTTTGRVSLRPVLEWHSVPGPLAGSGADNIDAATGLTIVDDISGESYLLDDGGEVVLFVGPAALVGTDIDSTAAFPTEAGGWVVSLAFTPGGSDRFAELTGVAASHPFPDPRRQIAIVLDGTVLSAPVVAPDVPPEVGITGGSAAINLGSDVGAESEAEVLASLLRYGALPVAFSLKKITPLG